MAREAKLLNRFYKKISRSKKGEEINFNSSFLEEVIIKAIRFIKVKQFHSGFPEFFSPERGGDIEVTIQYSQNQFHQFYVNFRFITLPGRLTLFQEQKIISYTELIHFADEYDKQKKQIDDELSHRDEVIKNHLKP